MIALASLHSHRNSPWRTPLRPHPVHTRFPQGSGLDPAVLLPWFVFPRWCHVCSVSYHLRTRLEILHPDLTPHSDCNPNCLCNIHSPWTHWSNHKLTMSKIELIIFLTKPRALYAFFSSGNGTTSHPVTQVRDLYVILNTVSLSPPYLIYHQVLWIPPCVYLLDSSCSLPLRQHLLSPRRHLPCLFP